jgi:LmeA-like phospholipid-binding
MSSNQNVNKNTPKIRVLTSVLKGALKLFLRSQVSDIQDLEIDITAGDRQLLSGNIPKVSVFASGAVYKGLHITSIQLTAENIRINTGSILKGQPLRLSEVIPVSGTLVLEEKDVNASLTSALLTVALNDMLLQLIPEIARNSNSIIWQKIILCNNQFILFANLSTETNTKLEAPLEIGVNLDLINSHELKLTPIGQYSLQHEHKQNGHHFDLGSDVDIQELELISGKVTCKGRININP